MSNTIEEQQPIMNHSILNEVPEHFIQEGEKLLAAYKGLTLHGLSGQSSDEQALGRGHFGGTAAGIISLFIYLNELLLDLSTLKPSLEPVLKKTKKGKIWVTDIQEALQLGEDYGYKIVQKGKWRTENGKEVFVVLPNEQDKYYFEYPGFRIEDTDIAMFAYNVARATSSFQGETKKVIAEALSNLKAVPIFPAMASGRPLPEQYTNIRESEE